MPAPPGKAIAFTEIRGGAELRWSRFAQGLLCPLSLAGQVLAAEPVHGLNQAPRYSSKYESAFEAMTADLANSEKSFDFVQVAIAEGDVAGATAALERILRLNPQLNNIKLELGVLYARVGRESAARPFIVAALQDPTIPPQVKRHGEEILHEPTRAAALPPSAPAPKNLKLSIFAGAQYETNPNAAPESALVVGLSGPTLISGTGLSVQRSEDYAGVFLLNSEYDYPLRGLGTPTELVGDATFYQNVYDETDNLNATSLVGRIGPRLYFSPGTRRESYVRPYVSGSYLGLSGDTYYSAFGGGVTFLIGTNSNVSIIGNGVVEHRDYDNSNVRPINSQQAGTYETFSLGAATPLGDDISVELDGFGEGASTRNASMDYRRLGVRAGVAAAVPAPMHAGNGNWLVTGSISYRNTAYDAPDPLIDPSHKRDENRFSVAGGLHIPISPRLAVELNIEYTNNGSNLPNYRYEDTVLGLGLSWHL